MYFRSSTESVPSAMTRSTTRARMCTKKCIRFDSCEINDTVLVVWNETLFRYIIEQVSIGFELFPSFFRDKCN